MLKRAYNSLSLSGEQRTQLCIERGGLTILAVDVIFSRPQHENSLKLQPVLRTSCKEAHRYCIKSNQIKSLLLSHHHSTSALVSEILESVLQTVQKKKKKNLHMDGTYLDCTKDNVQKKHIHILSTQCTIKTHYTPYVHILHYMHIYT